MTPKTLLSLAAIALLFAAPNLSAASKPARNTLALISARPAASNQQSRKYVLCWLEKQKLDDNVRADILSGKTDCPDANVWSPSTDSFRTGDVVRFVVTRPRFMSTFDAKIGEVVIKSPGPQINGLPDASPAAAEAPAAQGATKGPPPSVTAKSGDDLRNYVEKVLKPLAAQISDRLYWYPLLIGDPTNDCADPGLRLRTIRRFADCLESDTKAARSKELLPSSEFAADFDRANALASAVKSFNVRYKDNKAKLDDELKTLVPLAKIYVNTADKSGITPENSGVPNDLKPYLPGGSIYEQFAAIMDAPNVIVLSANRITLDEVAVFENVNYIYSHARSSDPIEVFVKQWTTNTAVHVDLTEKTGFTPNSGDVLLQPKDPAAADSSASHGADSLAPGAAPQASKKPSTPNSSTKPAAPGQSGDNQGGDNGNTPPPAPAGVPIYSASFDVHQIFHANVVSGFVASTLKNNEWSVSNIRATDDSGQPAKDKDGNPVFIKVPVRGEQKAPQLHYYIGINYYFTPLDTFPDRRPSIKPGVMFAYGVDDPFNFYIGPNFETKIGINIGIGYHLGRETVLAPGNTGGVTRLASDAKDAPTVKRIAHGAYFNVGFDLRVFKSIWGQLAGVK